MIEKQAVTSAIFDREFIKGFHGGVPNIKESKMLIAKRPKNDVWSPGKLYFPTETYESGIDPDIEKNNIGYVMRSVAERGFLEEFRPVEKCNLPNLDYIGWYKDTQTNYAVHVCLGNIWSPSSWSPRKDLGKMLNTTEEVPKYYWRTLPHVIKMMKKGKVAGEQAVFMIVQEIERRLQRANTTYGDELSRLILDL